MQLQSRREKEIVLDWSCSSGILAIATVEPGTGRLINAHVVDIPPNLLVSRGSDAVSDDGYGMMIATDPIQNKS